MNFRQKFEAWHLAKFGYVSPPIEPFTAMTVKYQPGLQQARWEGWCANTLNFYEEGFQACLTQHSLPKSTPTT